MGVFVGLLVGCVDGGSLGFTVGVRVFCACIVGCPVTGS